MHRVWVITASLFLVHQLKMAFPASFYIYEYWLANIACTCFTHSVLSIFRARWKGDRFFFFFFFSITSLIVCESPVSALSVLCPLTPMGMIWRLATLSWIAYQAVIAFSGITCCLVSSQWHYAPHNGTLQGLGRQEVLWKKGLDSVRVYARLKCIWMRCMHGNKAFIC